MQEQEKAAFARRLVAAMRAKGWDPRPSVLERRFNAVHWGRPITPHGVRRWLLGQTIPHQDRLVTLARLLEVDVNYLRFGTAGLPVAIAEPQVRWDEDIGWSERELFMAFLRLPIPQRRVVREVIQAFVRAHASEKGST